MRTKLAQLTKTGLSKKWRELGYSSEADYVADLIEISVHGFDHVASLQEERLRVIAGIGNETGVINDGGIANRRNRERRSR